MLCIDRKLNTSGKPKQKELGMPHFEIHNIVMIDGYNKTITTKNGLTYKFVTLLIVSVGYNVRATVLISNTGANLLGYPGFITLFYGFQCSCLHSERMG